MSCLTVILLFFMGSLVAALPIDTDWNNFEELNDSGYIPAEQWENQLKGQIEPTFEGQIQLQPNPSKRDFFQSLMMNHDRIKLLRDLKRNERILRMMLKLGR